MPESTFREVDVVSIDNRSEMSKDHWRPDYDGIRGVAVAAVMAVHLYLSRWFGQGFLGVDVFFVLSGLLITQILCRLERTPNALWRFYRRRVQRLWPALLAVAVCLLGLEALTAVDNSAFTHAATSATYLKNIAILANFNGPNNDPDLLGHTWSLAVEMQFYVLWPGLVLCLRGKPALFRLACLTLAIVGTAEWWLTPGLNASPGLGDSTPAAYVRPDLRVAEFALGAWCASVLDGHQAGRRVRPWFSQGAGLIALATSAFAAGITPSFGELRVVCPLAAFGTACLLVGLQSRSPVRRILEWKPLVYVGERSYSLYLTHLPAYGMLQLLWPNDLPLLAAWKLGVGVASGFLLHALIDKWARHGPGAIPKPRRGGTGVFPILSLRRSVLGGRAGVAGESHLESR